MSSALRLLTALVALLLGFFGPVPAGRAAPRPLAERPFKVVIDPGHGGSNHGCRAAVGQLQEKDVTLALAWRLAADLRRALPHAQVVLTRTRDETLTLAERVAFANAEGADLLISLHANASESRTQTGFETYLLDRAASSREAARIARRENDGALARPGAEDPAAAMVRQLALGAHRRNAAWLARRIQQLQAQAFPDRLDRGVRQAPFDVLMGARMPAVLFEIGFLDHPEEGPRLLQAQTQARISRALARAVDEYYRQVVRRQ